MTSQTTGARAATAETNQNFARMIEQGDASEVGSLYTNDAQLIPPGGEVVKGKPAIQAFWAGVIKMGIRRVDLTTAELDEGDDTAIEVGSGKLFTAAGDQIDEVKYIVVWKLVGEQWKIHRDIWNSSRAQG